MNLIVGECAAIVITAIGLVVPLLCPLPGTERRQEEL
jgi:hypothetical protein